MGLWFSSSSFPHPGIKIDPIFYVETRAGQKRYEFRGIEIKLKAQMAGKAANIQKRYSNLPIRKLPCSFKYKVPINLTSRVYTQQTADNLKQHPASRIT
jgi:hypothetical protein